MGSGLTSNDVRFLRCLESRTNVIPVLAQADTLHPEQVAQQKKYVLQELINNHIVPFKFDLPTPSYYDAGNIVYAISNERVPLCDDFGSPFQWSEYVPPQVHLDLGCLVNNIFSARGSAQLRYTAVQKLLSCGKRLSYLPTPATDGYRVIRRPSKDNQVARASLQLNETGELANTAQNLPRVGLESWAAGLQRSLKKQNAIRQQWMPHWRMPSLVAKSTSLELETTHYKGKGVLRSVHIPSASIRQQDPLGLIAYTLPLTWKSWNIGELIGRAGIIGN